MPDATILDTILEHKHGEVAVRRVRIPPAEIKQQAQDMPPPRDFLRALHSPRRGRIALIAEVKRASPSAGIIRADFHPAGIARAYADGGADCLSVLTDERFFQGSDAYLAQARVCVNLPVLRKDFVVDDYQVYEARALGADAILLIVSALSPAQVADYAALARSLGMAALVEVHTEPEMGAALGANAALIGINNRSLSTFTTDLQTTARLATLVPSHITLVAESGIKTHADVQTIVGAGAHAILVGETLMRAANMTQAVGDLLGPWEHERPA